MHNLENPAFAERLATAKAVVAIISVRKMFYFFILGRKSFRKFDPYIYTACQYSSVIRSITVRGPPQATPVSRKYFRFLMTGFDASSISGNNS